MTQGTKRMTVSDEVLDGAVNRVRYVIPRAKLCLESSVLLQRVLDSVADGHGFALIVGALHVVPDGGPPTSFDPRVDPRGADGLSVPRDAGYHSWLEHPDGTLLDCNILLTLAEDGLSDEDPDYFTCPGRRVKFAKFGLVYEPLPDLEVFGFEKSELHLKRAVGLALNGPRGGYVHDELGPNRLDIRWRTKLS